METYIIKYNVKYNNELYWQIGETTEIQVFGETKDNHQKAEDLFNKDMQVDKVEAFKVVRVSYV